MDNTKAVLCMAGVFIIGLGIGGGVSYVITKRMMEEDTQEAIDEMKAVYKQRLKEKGAKENEPEKTDKTGEETEKEEDFVRNDKPSIMEMSSIVNNASTPASERTKYYTTSAHSDPEAVKEAIRKLKDDKEKEKISESEQVVIDYDTYIQLTEQEYYEKNFTFETDTEEWRDWESDAQYDPSDLPFDTDIIQWNDDEQCYICDKGNHSVFVLEKV